MFGSSITLFRVFGLEIKVNPSWVFIALLLAWSLAAGYFPSVHEGLPRATYWAMSILAVAGIFASIVVHEIAHSLVARAYGIPMRGITLHMFGGAAEMEAEPTSPKAEFLMAIAGPAVSLVLAAILGGLVALVHPAPEAAGTIVVRYLAMLNLVLGIFNLLPAFPLDGGRVLRAAVWGYTGDLARATRIAAQIGMALGMAVAFLGFFQILTGNLGGGLWTVLIGFFIRSAAATTRLDLEARRMLTGRPVERFMTAAPVTVPIDMALETFVETVVYRTRHDTYPVVDGGGRPRGLVAVGDLHKIEREAWPRTSVLEIMTPLAEDAVVAPGDDAVAALDRMRTANQSRLLVVADGRLVGLLTLKDLLATLALKMEFEGEA
ncbi:site-2 protease family protein [Methyloraptor flagellatus]|jgi:Zn-dependent protease|uniref:Zinc metalloprotease n=1 Tax=Methyloraptor flagellatus TaxID=3162530 RepID=A0AAU7X9W6_9HYPH